MTRTRMTRRTVAWRRSRPALAVAALAVVTALTVPAQAAGARTAPGTDTAAAAEVPADVLDLTDWKLTLPTGEDEDPTEITQPELADYSEDPYFVVNEDGDGVRFQAPVNGVTTGGSSNPRSELREMTDGGEDEASWSSTEGTHTLTVKEAFTHVPEGRPYVVGAQIHGADDDVTALRLEGSKLYITEDDTTHHHLVTDDYQLGTPIELKYVVSDGEVKIYYNGELEDTLDYDGDGNYFKAGAYTQANCGNTDPCSDDNYGEVEIYDLSVDHGDGQGDGGDGDDPDGPSDDGTQAAVEYGWGDPLPISDEFDYSGPVDPDKWSTPSGDEGGTEGCWPGHNDNGRRCAKNSVVGDGILTMTGDENGDTGWLSQKLDAHYGRWEIRSRSYNTGDDGETYHPLHLIWPTSDDRHEDGEYDWVEYTDPDAQCLGAWLHYPDNPSDEKEHFEDCSVDMTQWHNFAFEWTPDGLTGYVDGKQYFHMADGADDEHGDIQDMPEGNLDIQLDNFTGTDGIRPAAFEVDWVRTYAVD
ncbi:polysaccharide lyase family 7 protein [Streptomyces odontomachi]|uniref:polysaccharide lyase family 7 protein n=1 Tax=Streptomyces odontomachi TaxID=2944940 RepID=UPI00210B5D41|nr:polysaccharide lyase family 7 protein [Streptomyces sp. ODS25]